MDFANVQHPGTLYDGRAIHSMLGKSLAPLLEGKTTQVYADDEPLGWELFGHKALYYGDYKILNIVQPAGDGTWKLYNISDDPRELIDISTEQPELLEQMIQMYENYAEEIGVVPPEPEQITSSEKSEEISNQKEKYEQTSVIELNPSFEFEKVATSYIVRLSGGELEKRDV